MLPVRVLAILAIALYLMPTGAHLFELPAKLAMTANDYMIVQRIYRGWALFGVAVFAGMLLTLLYAILRRHVRVPAVLALAAFLCLLATQLVFWAFTYPVNVASQNWTVVPEQFGLARRQWEYSHAASAGLTLLALLSMSTAVALDKDG